VAEADTRTLWTADILASFMTIIPAVPAVTTPPTDPVVAGEEGPHTEVPGAVQRVAVPVPGQPETFSEANEAFGTSLATLVAAFTAVDVREILTVYDAQRTIPYLYDRKLLKIGREAAARDLDYDEKRYVRMSLIDAIRARDVTDALDAAAAEGLPIVE
jgi:hypothetical protein